MRTMTCALMGLLLASALTARIAGPSEGVFFSPVSVEIPIMTLPCDFDIEQANKELLEAKERGDAERANELSLQINQWWKLNRTEEFDPEANVFTGRTTMQRAENDRYETEEPNYYASFWGTDVRIDSRDNCYGGNIVSLSNGDLYSVFIHQSLPYWFLVTKRSTNGGVSWSTSEELFFSNQIFDPGLSVADDILIMYYRMENASGQSQAWVRILEPGASLTPVNWGSPSGGYIDEYIRSFVVTNDGPNYISPIWVYAAWTQGFTTGTDETCVMFARSNNLDASTWYIHDSLYHTYGDAVYIYETDIENGSWCSLVLVFSLHPFGWPQIYDESVKAICSDNGGSSWSPITTITNSNNHLDENQPSIAGSHIDFTWFCILKISDTTFTPQHLYNYYSTDNGETWIEDAWFTSCDECFLPYVYIDYNSSGVFSVFRVNNGTSEELRFKEGDISNPTAWSNSVVINDDQTNLSEDFGPRICYDYASSNACVMWTDYHSAVNSVWFDRTAVTGVEEEPVKGDLEAEIFTVSQTGKNFSVTYSVETAGRVSIDVWDVTGRNVAEVFDGTREPGTYTLEFTPEFEQGTYFFTINTSQGKKTRRIFLVE